ncbi:hypothetical protein A9Q83_04035 [Alphaproteobacteria bacterium 46_93_T64]|nr:hypothetical protein A9Q83_04035 [Alphaproteobacteria bacterium 46_93_T64]
MLETVLLAGALVLFFEGALYALFPDGMKRMMISVLQTSSLNLRIFGLLSAIFGVVCVWLLK